MVERINQIVLIEILDNVERRNRRRYRPRGNAFEDLSDIQFLKVFRLSKELTRFLIMRLAPYITSAQRQHDLDINTKVLVFLRFVATGSYQMDVGYNFNFSVSQSSVSRCIEEVANALNHDDVFNEFVRYPANIEELNHLRTGFYRRYNFPGVIGCIDCTHIAIYPPKINHEEYPEHVYLNRKQYHSINTQLICDYNLKILNINARFPGSTNDAFIWRNSTINDILRRLHEEGNTNYFLLGDSGYPLRTWLMTPLNYEPLPNTNEHLYNSKHKTIRSLIERCNGLLKMRFRCLLKHRVLHYDPQKCGKIINACAVLHNLCIEHNIPLPDEEFDNADFGVYEHIYVNDENDEDRAMARVNPLLVAGRNLRSSIIRNLQ